jgi:hypothetical protein
MLLVREKATETAILGHLYVTDMLVYPTLENRSKALPEGVYKLDVCMSPRFKRELPLIYNDGIPASRGFRIHEGNSYLDSSGCLLVAMRREDERLIDSRRAVDIVTSAAYADKSLIITSTASQV